MGLDTLVGSPRRRRGASERPDREGPDSTTSPRSSRRGRRGNRGPVTRARRSWPLIDPCRRLFDSHQRLAICFAAPAVDSPAQSPRVRPARDVGIGSAASTSPRRMLAGHPLVVVGSSTDAVCSTLPNRYDPLRRSRGGARYSNANECSAPDRRITHNGMWHRRSRFLHCRPRRLRARTDALHGPSQPYTDGLRRFFCVPPNEPRQERLLHPTNRFCAESLHDGPPGGWLTAINFRVTNRE